MTDASRKLKAGAMSVALHAGFVTAVVLCPIATMPVAHKPQRLVMPLVAIPRTAVQKPHEPIPPPAVTLPPLPEPVLGMWEPAPPASVPPTGEVEVGALDGARPAAGLALGYSTSGKVVVGGLNTGVASAQPAAVGGGVGASGMFAPLAPVGPGGVSTGPAASARPGAVGGAAGASGMFALLAPAGPGGASTGPAADESARLLSAPEPVYNELARSLHVTGEVVLEVRLAATGAVNVLRVLRGLGYGLDEAAIDAVSRIRFQPARRAGHPVDMVANITVVFKLT
jgi:protein TonB